MNNIAASTFIQRQSRPIAAAVAAAVAAADAAADAVDVA
jgi:hypothetical protein